MSINSRLQFFSKIFKRSSDLETYIQKAFGKRAITGYNITPVIGLSGTAYYASNSAALGDSTSFKDNFNHKGSSFPLYEYESGDPIPESGSFEVINTKMKRSSKEIIITKKEEGMGYVYLGTVDGTAVSINPCTAPGGKAWGIKVIVGESPIIEDDKHQQPKDIVPYTTQEYEKQIALAAKNSAELTDVNIQARVNKVKSGDNTGETNWFVETVWDNVDLVMKGLILDGMHGQGDDINGPAGAYCITPTEITTISGLSSLYASLEGVDGQGNHFIVRDKFVKNVYDQFISEGMIASSISPSGDQTHYTFFVANPHTLTFSAEGPGKAQAFIDDGDPGTEFFSPATMKFGTESYFELTPDTGKYYDFCEQIVSGYEPYVDYSNPDAWPVFTFNMDIGFKFHFSDTQFDIEKTNLTFTGEFSAGSALTVDVTGIATEQFQHGFRMHITGHDTATPPVSIDLVTGLTYANYEGEESCSGDVVIDGVYYEVHLYPSETEGHYTLSVYRVEE